MCFCKSHLFLFKNRTKKNLLVGNILGSFLVEAVQEHKSKVSYQFWKSSYANFYVSVSPVNTQGFKNFSILCSGYKFWLLPHRRAKPTQSPQQAGTVAAGPIPTLLAPTTASYPTPLSLYHISTKPGTSDYQQTPLSLYSVFQLRQEKCPLKG